MGHLVEHRGDVQHRLRRNAADVEADAAERRHSARPAPPSGRGRRRGTRPSSRRGRRRARAGRSRGRRRRRRPVRPRHGAAPRRRGCGRRGGCRRGRGAGAAAAAGAALGAGAGDAPAAASSRLRITEPSLTVSPTLTLISLTTPACDDGISIDALSLSIVIRLCSTLTLSPGLTRTSMTPTSLKSPMSGTLHVDGSSAAPAGSRRGSGSGRR